MDRLKTLTMLLLLGVSVLLGLWLAWRFLQRQRRLPVPVAVHLLLAGAGLEAFAMLRRGAPDGTVMPADPLSNAAGLSLVVAMLTGLLLSIVARQLSRGSTMALLLGHGLLGLGGWGLFCVWVARA